MTAPDVDGDLELDAFLRDLEALEADPEASASAAALGILALSDTIDPVAPPDGARARLLDSLPAIGRYARFAESVAKILDLGLAQAKALLDKLDDESLFSTELPGISFFWVDGGPQVANAVRGFLRVTAGTEFPDHGHLGLETVLVLQGAFTDPARGITVRAGEIDIMPADSSHAYTIPKDGPDLLMLAVIQVGVRMRDQTFLPRG